MGTMLFGNGGIIGCSIGGAVLGQAAIPVPVLGAVVGGIIGGIAGSAGTSAFVDKYKQ